MIFTLFFGFVGLIVGSRLGATLDTLDERSRKALVAGNRGIEAATHAHTRVTVAHARVHALEKRLDVNPPALITAGTPNVSAPPVSVGEPIAADTGEASGEVTT